MKKQFKKSLSLFLAVLMMLSCWVWVAPEKAEAADYGLKEYTITVDYWITTEGSGNNAPKEVKIDTWSRSGNGTNAEVDHDEVVFANKAAEGEGDSVSTTCTGWPSRIWFGAYDSGTTGAKMDLDVKSIKINDRVVWSGNVSLTKSIYNGTIGVDFYPNTRNDATKDGSAGTISGGETTDAGKWDWPRPKLTFEDVENTLDIGDSAAALPQSATFPAPKFVDQYGVKWSGTITQETPSITLKNGGTATGMSAAVGSNLTTVVTAGINADTHNSGKDTSAWVLKTKYVSKGTDSSSTIEHSVNVMFYHPEYTITYNANNTEGGRLDVSDGAPFKGVYGAPIHIPSLYTYKGKQLSDPAFHTDKNGDDKKGSALTESTEISGNQTYYAQWENKDINVTILAADGQTVGIIKAKYNDTLMNYYGSLSKINEAVRGVADEKKFEFGDEVSNKNELVWTVNGVQYDFVGWRVYSAYDLDGKVVNSLNGLMYNDNEAVIPGDIAFQAVYKPKSMETYTVRFYDIDDKVLSQKSGYYYGDLATGLPTGLELEEDVVYKYEHIGWAKKVDKLYYTVDDEGKDKDGGKISYINKESAEILVTADADYVPVFKMTHQDYTVTFNYTLNNNVPADPIKVEGYHWGDNPTMVDIPKDYTAGGTRYSIVGWVVNDDYNNIYDKLGKIVIKGNTKITAYYGDPKPAVYTINFLDKDGNLINDEENENQYNHLASVNVPTIGDPVEGDNTVYDIPATIIEENTLYTFKEWSPSVKNKATADVTYQAIYDKKDYADVIFYNYDGTVLKEFYGKKDSIFEGDIVPLYENYMTDENGNNVAVPPSREEDEVGTYEFIGWKDNEGNPVVPGETVITGNTYLIAQYKTNYTEYEVIFLNDVLGEDGKKVEISKATYHYGDKIVIPEDPTKAGDVEFSYEFREWSPEVSEYCRSNATYTANYRRYSKEYKVTWFNDNREPLTVPAIYNYNAKIQQAVLNEPVNLEAPEIGKVWAFKHWVQCNEYGYVIYEDGKELIFKRGDRMPAKDLYFYPVFEQVDKLYTVNFYKEDGTTLIETIKIPHGGIIADYNSAFVEKAYKPATDTHHYKLNDKWLVINGENAGAEVDVINETLLVDGVISLKPTYTKEEHQKVVYEIVAEPTCTVPGFANYKCLDDECSKIDYNVAIPIVDDNDAPIGKLYVGNNLWDSNDFGKIDYDEITYVSANTFLIVNANDVGTRTKPNPDAKLSRGVGKMEYFISTEKITDLTTVISGWTPIYNYEEAKADVFAAVLDEYKLTFVEYIALMRSTDDNDRLLKAEIDREVDEILARYNANATGIVSNLNLEEGKDYIIYIRLSDREGFGEVNVSYLSSGTINYGSKAPEITVSGNGFGNEFCSTATVTVTDDLKDGAELYLNGEKVELVDGAYTCNVAGNYTATAIDKHGNQTSKVFEIKGKHSYRQYTIAESCETTGSKYYICTLCGDRTEETTIPAKGHSFTVNYVDTAPDCVNDGYRTYVCDNNCGLTLVLYPTSSADDLAQAKKFVEPAEDEEEGTWVALTAADLKHLVATGKHTYAMVKDENGKDTAEYEWVIDKKATCKTVGSKHRDCTVCGLETARVTEEIPIDTENGHNFYRVKIISEPLCQEIGKKGKTCRYCGYVETTEYIPALGHVAGKYVTIVEPTCVDKGSEMLTCAVCESWIGEGEYDPMKAPVAKEIPALDHAWILDGEIYQDAVDGKWYQNKVCQNDAEHTKRDEVEGYVPPVAATVTFDFVDGYYVDGEEHKSVQYIETLVGNEIAAAKVNTGLKAEDLTYTYTFSHWADEDGKEVKFPIEVKGDAIYYAVYAEKQINYTITYYAEDGITEIGKTGYLKNGETYDLAKGPAKAATAYNTYEFEGWIFTTDDPTDENIKPFNTYTINGSDVKLKAKYSKADRYYAVTYAYDTENILETFLVKAGSLARPCFETPTKAYDNVYHYTFKGWDKAEQLRAVESNIYTTPVFDAVEHNRSERVVAEASCTGNKVVYYGCKDECGYSYTAEIADTALGHDWKQNEETNKFECQRVGCNAIEDNIGTVSYTITYFNAIGKVYTHSYKVYMDTVLSTVLPAAPEKAADKMYTYTFIGWSTVAPPTEGEDTRTALDAENTAVKSDLKLYPLYEGSLRKYTVVYAYNAGAYIGEEEVTAGQPAEKEFKNITKESDTKYHYTFKEWNKAEELKAVYSDIYTTPNFTHTAHTFKVTVKEAATCKADRVDTYTCTCGYTYDRVVPGTKIAHSYGDPDENGVRHCQREGCDATTSEGVTYSIVYYNAKGNVYTRAYNIKPGTLLGGILPLNGPAKAADKEYTYTFKGWATKADDGTLTPVAADATVDANLNLYPDYDSAKRTYTVKFLNATGDVIYETTVEAGEAAVCPIHKLPTKAPDGKYHYTFKGWNKAEELNAVYSDVVTSADFTAVEHTMDNGVVTTAATCQQPEIKTYTCTAKCGYSREAVGSTGDHVWGEPETANGVTTIKCTVEGCNESKTTTAVYTVKYYADKDATEASVTKIVEHGKKVADISVTTPTKAKDDAYTYEFSHWALKTDADEKNVAETAVTADIELVAIYTATARLYSVVFAYDAKNVIESHKDKTFAKISTALYTGATPVKDYDNNYHYTFKEWKLDKKDLDNSAYIYYAAFTKTEHSMKIDSSATVGATCTKGESILEKCQYCDYTINYEQGGPLGHKLVEKEGTRVPATPTQKGSVIFECIRCDYEEPRELVWSDSGSDDDDSGNTEQSKNATIKVSVTDGRNAVQNAKVDIYSGGNYITTKYTNAQGVTTFEVAKGKYNIVITVTNADKVEITKDVQADCEIVGSVSIRGCGCACHRDNIWGAIFRFFHKIIKMLTGEFKCCSDPSHLYG